MFLKTKRKTNQRTLRREIEITGREENKDCSKGARIVIAGRSFEKEEDREDTSLSTEKP